MWLHRIADEKINQGLSPIARGILAVGALLSALAMAAAASLPSNSDWGYVASVFCLLISIACVTKGRVRQFFGSVIGFALFLIACWYFVEAATGSVDETGGTRSANIALAATFFWFFGLPGLSYVRKSLFGFRSNDV